MTTTRNSAFVIGFNDIDKTMAPLAGGKAANLGELARIEDILVPDGFCVTTEAYKNIVGNNKAITSLLGQLADVKVTESDRIRRLCANIRREIEDIRLPGDITNEISRLLERYGAQDPYAIRSSATAEDLPTASFAGQQDTYLNVTGKEETIKHIGKCWASLFTDRAVAYRIQNGFDHRKVHLAVVVQKMVFPEVSGILFTADPVTGNRKISSVDAGFGLGEALVSGIVNADVYTIKNGSITGKKIAVKTQAVYAAGNGGTRVRELPAGMQRSQVLTDRQLLQLERMGRKIEAHFGSPQDIEWCLAGGEFYIVQSRPITTLFPVPVAADNEHHVYVSVGHQQMMTDAMKPLGLSVWNLTAARPMFVAGGRLFVDVAGILATAAGRDTILNVLGKSDPLIRDALTTLLERGDFIPAPPLEVNVQDSGKASQEPALPDFKILNEYDPAIVEELIGRSEAAMQQLKHDIGRQSGAALFDFMLGHIQQLRKSVSDPESFGVIMTGVNAAAWLNEKIQEWLGEKNVADTLAQSVPHNVTSEMGLALLDVADAIRPYTAVVAYLQQAKDDDFLQELNGLEGGPEAAKAIGLFLEKYGMRCAGEIDITRPRWSEKPATLIPVILGNVKNFAPGESKRRLAQGLREAAAKEQEITDRLKDLPGGEEKIAETKRMIRLLRHLVGYREYPKYHMISGFFIYKQALMKEAERLVQAGVIREKEDVYFLSFEELQEAVRTHRADYALIDERKAAFSYFEKLTPPRIITSDGEILTGRYSHESLPANAIAGLAVSSGVVEGRARVILHMAAADLEAGDILVTRFTDPSWTPLFVSIKGLVTEVGGLMTHGAVIAREYGLPAVVGIDNATKLIKDGQRIRVNGTDGYVEIIDTGS
jgi:pyruvate,water dikinase